MYEDEEKLLRHGIDDIISNNNTFMIILWPRTKNRYVNVTFVCIYIIHILNIYASCKRFRNKYSFYTFHLFVCTYDTYHSH